MTTTLSQSSEPPASEETTPGAEPAPERHCSHCGAALGEGQDWCLECGAATPGALRSGRPARAGAILFALTGVLVITAAGAAYAALRTPAKHVVLKAGPVTVTPLTPATPPTSGATGTTGATGSVPPATTTKLPPTPTPATIPAAPKVAPPTITTPTPAAKPPSSTSTSTTTRTSTTTTQTASGPTPLLLDTNATSDYNPNNYPIENFGDPSLAIDGDTTTSWSAQVPATPAAGGDAGLLVDLRSAQELSSLKLVTDTPGASFVVLGANGSTAPSTIGDPGWTRLSAVHAAKRTQTFGLTTKGHRYRWLVVWILGAKGGPVATLPGTVATAATATVTLASQNSATGTTGASGPSGASTQTSTSSASATTTTTTQTSAGPLVTVDVNELTIYP